MPGAHVKNHCHAGGNSIIHLSFPAKGRWVCPVKLDVHGLCVRLAHPQILEQILPRWSVHGAPLTILVLLPCRVEERWRRVARGWQESKHWTPTAKLGVPHEQMLERVRLANHHLQGVDRVAHECNTGGVSIWNLVHRLEQRVIERLEKLGRHGDWIRATCPSIGRDLLVADRCKAVLELRWIKKMTPNVWNLDIGDVIEIATADGM